MSHQAEKPMSAGSEMQVRSANACYHDLPELLKTHAGWWVAYHGDCRLGPARTETELYQSCLAQGLPEDEFLVLLADHQALSDREPTDLPPGR